MARIENGDEIILQVEEPNFIGEAYLDVLVLKKRDKSIDFHLELELDTDDKFTVSVSPNVIHEVEKLRDVCNQVLEVLEKAEKELAENGSRENRITRE